MLKSPSAGWLTVVLMRWIWLRELMVASTRYFPNMVMATTCTRSGTTTLPSRPFSICSQRQKAIGLAPGSRAALRNPGGLSHRSSR